ncbi:EamA family transporter [Salinicoccus albus]|uniref:EamA family transporter n=1 Tax=Salinicoccus albus TaxID=418756 RepID=UPI0003750EED|nr:EamA family transporter [Salinicoccus albus]
MKNGLAPLLILMGAILWGTVGTANTYAPGNVESIAMGAMRLLIGGIVLSITAALMGKLTLKGWPVKAVVLAALFMALFQPFFFTAVSLTGVAVGTVVCIGSAPVFSGLIEWSILKSRPSGAWWASTALAVTGCITLMFNTNTVTVDPLGILSGLGAGVSFAGYTILNSKLVRNHHPIAIVALVFTTSAIMLLPFLFIYDTSWLREPSGISVALYIGLIATGIAYFLFSSGLKHVKSSTAVTLALAEPLTAALLGVFLVGEVLDGWSWAGLIMLLMGIVILVFQSRQRSVRAEV